MSLEENVHRADMNSIDKAHAYQDIFNRYRDHTCLAKETGVTVSTVHKYLSLLNLAPSIQQQASTSDGPAGIGTLSNVAEELLSRKIRSLFSIR